MRVQVQKKWKQVEEKTVVSEDIRMTGVIGRRTGTIYGIFRFEIDADEYINRVMFQIPASDMLKVPMSYSSGQMELQDAD